VATAPPPPPTYSDYDASGGRVLNASTNWIGPSSAGVALIAAHEKEEKKGGLIKEKEAALRDRARPLKKGKKVGGGRIPSEAFPVIKREKGSLHRSSSDRGSGSGSGSTCAYVYDCGVVARERILS